MTVADTDAVRSDPPPPPPPPPRPARQWRGLQSLPPCSEFEARYTLHEEVGEGSYAVVRRAVHNASRRECAVKCFQADRLTKQQMLDVHQEVALLQRLRHPNIVGLYGAYYSEDRVCLVLEHLRGGDLKTLLSRPFLFDEETAATVLGGVLQALRYLHGHSIVHGDIKPENILFKHALPEDLDELYDAPALLSHVKLIDFGFARVVGKQDDQKQCHGTPYYMAPEVINCGYNATGPPYGRAIDLWSTGVVGFVMLTRTSPFEGKTCRQLFRAITAGVWDFPADCDVTPDAADFFQRLLVVDPAGRLTAGEALRHPWIQRDGADGSALERGDTSGSSDLSEPRSESPSSATLLQRRTGRPLTVRTPCSSPPARWARGRRPTKKLVLSRADVAAGVDSLVELLARHPSVTHVDLSQEPWSPVAGGHVMRLLRATPSIRRVDAPGGQTYTPSRLHAVEALLLCTPRGTNSEPLEPSLTLSAPQQA
eukprot:EG_transcript_2727